VTDYSSQIWSTLRHCAPEEKRSALQCMREVENNPYIGKATRLSIAGPGDRVHRAHGWEILYYFEPQQRLAFRILKKLESL